MNVRTRLMLGFAVVVLVACAASKTRDEFRANVAGGRALSAMDTYVAKRGFDEVTRMLKQKSEECLNYQMTQSHSEGAMTTSKITTNFTASFQVVNNNHAELTIRKNPKGKLSFSPGAPEGGLYYVAIDIDRLTPNTTKLTYYGPSGWDKGYSAIKSWSDGHPARCPYT